MLLLLIMLLLPLIMPMLLPLLLPAAMMMMMMLMLIAAFGEFETNRTGCVHAKIYRFPPPPLIVSGRSASKTKGTIQASKRAAEGETSGLPLSKAGHRWIALTLRASDMDENMEGRARHETLATNRLHSAPLLAQFGHPKPLTGSQCAQLTSDWPETLTRLIHENIMVLFLSP